MTQSEVITQSDELTDVRMFLTVVVIQTNGTLIPFVVNGPSRLGKAVGLYSLEGGAASRFDDEPVDVVGYNSGPIRGLVVKSVLGE